jgi:hypothetical protein
MLTLRGEHFYLVGNAAVVSAFAPTRPPPLFVRFPRLAAATDAPALWLIIDAVLGRLTRNSGQSGDDLEAGLSWNWAGDPERGAGGVSLEGTSHTSKIRI